MIKKFKELDELIDAMTSPKSRGDTFKYLPLLDKFKLKIPSIKDIKNHELDNISDSFNIRFQYKHTAINVEQNGSDDYYPVTNNEILSLLSFYGRLKQLNTITIKMYKQLEIQGMVSRKDNKTLPGILMLTIPSKMASKKYKDKSIKGYKTDLFYNTV